MQRICANYDGVLCRYGSRCSKRYMDKTEEFLIECFEEVNNK